MLLLRILVMLSLLVCIGAVDRVTVVYDNGVDVAVYVGVSVYASVSVHVSFGVYVEFGVAVVSV